MRSNRQEFEEQGYFVFDPEIPNEVLDGVLEDTASFYFSDENVAMADAPPDPARGMTQNMRIQDAWKFSKNVMAVAKAPRVLAILEELLGREPIPFQTLSFPYATAQHPHSDTIHFNSMPPGFMVGVWVAFEDMDMENGPLIYYPGSQKLPEYNMADVGVEPLMENYPQYEEFIQGVIAREGLQPEYGLIRKGQALVWHANLLHGGSKLKDHDRTRHSQVTHYYFEGCRYYTPMLTKYHMRDPERIG